MSTFNYTLPSGSIYTVIGPDSATQEQADYIFYSQVAAGALVGYQKGQTLAGVSVSPHVFSLSRLERGTAGVSGNVDGTSVISTDEMVSILQNLPVVSDIPVLTNVPLLEPIGQADVLQARGDGLGPGPVGPLSSIQVQCLEAQIAKIVNQPYNQISLEKGIGKYGFTCYQLEKVGYVKPTTQARFIDPDSSKFVEVMYNPSIWLGKNNINSLEELLSNEELQNIIQQNLMQCGYDGLKFSGIISETPTDTAQPTVGYVYQNGGLTTTSLEASQSGLVDGTITPVGVLAPQYNSTIAQADLQHYYYEQVQSSLSSKVLNEIGALVSNASKFGPETTSLWAVSGKTNNFSRLMASGFSTSAQASNKVNQSTTFTNSLASYSLNVNPVTGALTTNSSNPVFGYSNFGSQGITSIPPSVATSLNNQLPQISSVMDSVGKASQFATGFVDSGLNSNDLMSIDRLSSLTSTILPGTNGLSGSLAENIQGIATGSISAIQNGISDISKLDLGSMSGVGQLASQLLDKAGLGGIFGSLSSLGSLLGGTNGLLSGFGSGAGFSGTSDRATVDSATKRIIGSAKIDAPTFTSGKSSSAGSQTDISAAQKSMSSLGKQTASVTASSSNFRG